MNDRDRFDKFTERARKVLSLAQEEAQRFQHNYIGTEHLLLGLVREGEATVAARILGIEDRFGSIEAGKVADLVLYDGDPFEHATHVTRTIQQGRIVYDRAEYLKLPFERRALPLVRHWR